VVSTEQGTAPGVMGLPAPHHPLSDLVAVLLAVILPIRTTASTAGDLEGAAHDPPELKYLFVKPVSQGQALPALALEVGPLLREPVFLQAKKYQALPAPAL
jgi:hypothetical protein